MVFYILLGKYGKIASSLKIALKKNNQNVFCISWKILENILTNRDSIKNYFYTKNKKYYSISKFIIINCLDGQISYRENLIQNIKIKKNLKDFNLKYSYIYLSTFEPQLNSLTNYRKIKKRMEKVIIKQGDSVVRIGLFINNYSYSNDIGSSNIVLSNLKFIPIYIPVTLSNLLVKYLIDMQNIDYINKILRCYSESFIININYKYPYIRLTCIKKPNYIKIPIPFFLISKISNFIAIFFQSINNFLNFGNFFQKPLSLLEQQKYINNGKFNFKNEKI